MLEKKTAEDNSFEAIMHVDEVGNEYWHARDYMRSLGYKDWRNFLNVISKATTATKNVGLDPHDHFVEITKMVDIGSGAQRSQTDYLLSRYACYLIAQNGDPGNPRIAAAQTYFAVQTRKQEKLEEMSDDEKRLHIRGNVKTHNKKLQQSAAMSGVKNFGRFNNWGYMGLYDGLTSDQVKRSKGIEGNLLDEMGATELAANLFRITQTDDRLRKDVTEGKTGEIHASNTHFYVGKRVREAIKEIDGTMPENLPKEEDIKKIERRVKKQARLNSSATKKLPDTLKQ